jgi:hypothetical protein
MNAQRLREWLERMSRHKSVYAEAVEQEWHVTPRGHYTNGDRFIIYHDLDGSTQHLRESEWEVRNLCENLKREWRNI